MRKPLAMLLLSAMLLALLPAAAAQEAAAVPTEVAQILFLTDAVYAPSGDAGVATTMYTSENHVYWQQDSRHLIVLDAHGRRLFNEMFYSAIELPNGLMALAKDYNYALYRGATRLTGYDYYTVTVEGGYIRGAKTSDQYDFFTMNGEKVAAPKAPSGWQVENLFGDNAVIARQYNSQSGYYERSLFDRQGKRLSDKKWFRSIFIEDDFLTTSEDWTFTAEGKPAMVGQSELRYTGPVCPGLYCMETGGGVYYIVDKNVTVRSTFDLSQLPRKERNISIFDERYVVILREKRVEIYNLEGQLLLTCDGESVEKEEVFSRYQPEPWGLIVKNGVQYTCYDTELKLLVQADKLQGMYFLGEYLVTIEKNNSRTYYDKTGKEVFSCPAEGGYDTKSGVILHEKDGLFAVCGTDGKPITPYEYNSAKGTDYYGLVAARKPAEDTIYYLNAAGQVVFSGGLYDLQFSSHFDKEIPNALLIYGRDGKYGITRYIAPGASAYVDVPESAWYHDAAFYCIDRGLFNGTAPDSFSPEDSMTRAMLVTVLWRYAGQKEEGTNTFTDVPAGQWYAKAVAWAAKNGVVNGTSDATFSPDDNISREQMATILYRYAKSLGIDVSKQKALTDFPDASQVSNYAREALSWCAAEGIIGGSDGKLLPQGNATRAQVAAVLMRFIENVMTKAK